MIEQKKTFPMTPRLNYSNSVKFSYAARFFFTSGYSDTFGNRLLLSGNFS